MRNFKKFLTLVLAVMMVVSAMSFTTSAAVTAFEDVDADNEALVEAVDLLEYMGITKGVSATQFGADQAVTREQFALFMYRLMKGGKDAPASASNTTKFTDLEDATYFYAISWANAKGIINGTSDTTFHPKNGITLQDAYTMVVRALDYEVEEDLIYPHGYIDIAEQLGVELDAGLSSDLDYEDTLTRGDMAIILYNAFFAETAIAEVETKEVKIGESDNVDVDQAGENDTWVLKEYTTYPRLCEKHFDVKEVEYWAVATPNRAIEGNDPTYDLGYDAILFEALETEGTAWDEVPNLVYLEPEQIKLAADELNDKFLGVFTMFVITDEEDEEIEKVLFSDCNLVKKTVTDLTLGTVSSNKAGSYYADTDSKLLSGKITTGTEVIYAYNAPYTYIKPTYVTGASAYTKYMQRNSNNILAVDYVLDNDDDVDYFVADFYGIVEYPDADTVDEGFFATQAEDLAAYFEQVYYGGLYEADLYDLEGDGVYDLIDYHPYSFFQVDSDEDYEFVEEDCDFEGDLPYIYTNEAYVMGADFVDEDYVLGYFDFDTNVVKVAEVVKPTVSAVSKIKSSTGSIVLADGTPVNVGSAWTLVNNIAPAITYDDGESYEAYYDVVYEDSFNDFVLMTANATGLLNAERLDEEEAEFYIYDGKVLYFDGIDDNLKFTENLIIPLQVNDNTPERTFNSETGARVWYIYAWVDGECKYVPVETEDALPEVIDGGELTAEYDMQLCTYSVDADGIYTIKSLGYDVDDDDEEYKGIAKDGVNDTNDDGEFILDTDEEDEQFIVLGDEGVTMTKKAGTRFELDGGSLDRDVVLKSYTKILVLTYDAEEDEYEMVEYDATSFKASAETAFDTVTYLVANNPDSKVKEDLVLLFATVDGEFDLETKKDKNGQRIVSLSTPGVDENGYFRNYYTLFNPLTGAKEEDVAGNDYKSTSNGLNEIGTGYLVELKGGMVDEKGWVSDAESDDYLGHIDTANNEAGLVWITEYDAADDFIAVVPVSATEGATDSENFEDLIEGYEFNGELNFDNKEFITLPGATSIFFEVNNDTAVSVLKYADAGSSTTKWGTMTLGDISTIADAKKEFKCYSDKVEDKKGNYTTKYAPYLMAYVSATEGDDPDEDLPVADYIIIVVNELDDIDMLLKPDTLA